MTDSGGDRPLLELRNVTRTYFVKRGLFGARKPLRAVKDVSLSLNKGEVLGLVGESGCGKSTLAKILIGLEAPSSGEVLLDGTAISKQGALQISRRVQPVFQNPYASLNPRKRVADIVAAPLIIHGMGSAEERRARVAEMLEFVGLPPALASSYPSQLSGGQRQRVAVARALIIRPEVVVLDEPTSALDVSVQAQILNLLLDLREELGLTYLMISHDLAVIEYIATRVAVMYLGALVEESSAEAVFREPKHPYTKALLSSVLTPEPRRGIPDVQLGAGFPNPLNPPSGCAFHPRCAQAVERCRVESPPIRDYGDVRAACHAVDEENRPSRAGVTDKTEDQRAMQTEEEV